MLSVRILNVDYYLSPPTRGLDVTYSHFRGAPVRLVPVIRVFGITPSGAKSCIHIHNVMPYIYVPYDGRGSAESQMYQIANGLDDVINKESGTSFRQHIFKIVLVSGIPFYGYHSKEHQYFKIYFYNPSVIKKAVNHFQNGSVNNTKYQPYEAHIPFVLQFFIDYNLYGMSFMHLAKWVQRTCPSENDSQSSLSQNNLKVTYCELEGDAIADDIKNKTDISGNINPGLANIWAEELERRKVEGKPSMSSISESQERTDIKTNDFEMLLKEQLLINIEQRMSSEILEDNVETNYPIETPEHSTLPAAYTQTSHVDSNLGNNEIDDLNLTPDDSVFLNSQDMSLVFAIDKLMTGENVTEVEKADCDSILGTQKEPNEESDEETDRVDLSQPLVLINDSEETVGHLGASETLQENQNNDLDNDWNDVYWCGVENISQISLKVKEDSNSKPLYVDGNMDDDSPDKRITYDKTPEKRPSTSGSVTPKRRYQPLKISVQKSPSRLSNSQKEVGESNPKSGEINLFKQLQLSAAKIDEQIRSPNKSPLVKQIVPVCVKSPSREKVEKLRKKLGTEMKAVAGKKNKISGKSYKSLRIHMLKRSKSNEDQGLTSLELNNETIGEPSKFHEKNTVTDSDQHTQMVKNEKARKSLFQNSGSPQTSSLSNSLPSSSTVKEPCSFNSRSPCNESLNSSSLDVSADLGIISFYDTTNYNIKPCNLFPVSSSNKYIYEPLHLPPSYEDVVASLDSYGLRKYPKVEPFYSDPKDDPSSGKEIGLDVIKVATRCTTSLGDFVGSFGNPLASFHSALCNELLFTSLRTEKIKSPFSLLASQREVLLMPVRMPPTYKQAKDWIKNKNSVPIPKSEKEKKKKIYIQQSPSCFETESVILTPTPSENLSQLSVVYSTPDALSLQNPSENVAKSQNSNMTGDPVPDVNKNNSEPTSSLGSLKLSTMVNKDELVPELNFRSNSCALECVTPDNSGAFKMDLENLHEAHAVCDYKYVTLLELEVHVQTRGEMKPDPEHDPISAIFYSILNDVPPDCNKPRQITGVIIFSEDGKSFTFGGNYLIETMLSEIDLINSLINIVRKWDPDILIGYEIEMLSWGYLIERGYKLGINLINELSRVKTTFAPNIDFEAPFRYYDLKLNGRIVLNIWKLMRHEIALMSYSFENVVYHILHTRVPTFSFKTLSIWWNNNLQYFRELTIKHYLIRVLGVIQMIEQLDLVGRTSELASLFGIQFYEVFSRGSQFRVESMMLRMAKPMNLVAISPSIQQRAVMKAPECLPLIMEPKSRFYGDPVIVLDFQSLYPSMIIAYNYCFSTCLGRIHHLAKNEYFEFGCSELKVPLKDLIAVKDSVHISPVGIAYVKPNIRLGVLPRMLEEILNTRLMVKQSLKEHKNNKTLRRVLDARQLGLKLIANVTYGYTSANFSGRMACVEVADSVVSKGRETLESAINLVNRTKKWGAKVVYGDTDSLFVLCSGKTRKEAFLIGQEIADAVTQINPKPVKLKLEKVYQPCILQTKKRYVGYMYESVDQEQPVYDAKGIETVRRDGCPAVSKILEKSLKILFETCDVSRVKDYVTRQMVKLMSGRLGIQDLTFAREFRGLNGYKPGACVPALKLAKEWVLKDRRAEPRVGERVGYIIACGPPGLPLIKLVHSPVELLTDLSLRVNHEYYITKAILPPLDRCFNLLGVDVFSWYASVPKKQYIFLHSKSSQGSKRGTISQYFSTMNCLICNSLCTSGVCETCQQNPQKLSVTLTSKINKWERKHALITKLCFSCCGGIQGNECSSLDCPVLYQRILAKNDLKQADCIREIQGQYLLEQF